MSEEMATVVYSEVLGLLPCRVVGCNETHCLVHLLGTTKPMSVQRSAVFELDSAQELLGGQIARSDVQNLATVSEETTGV